MIKAIAVAVGVALTLVLSIGKRWFTLKAKKRKLLGKIRELEYEMCSYGVGSVKWSDLDRKLRQLNQEYADLCRNE